MADPFETIQESPVDFAFAVAYVFQPTVRRLLLLQLVGVVFLQWGSFSVHTSMDLVHKAGVILVFWELVELGVLLAGIVLLIAGFVGLVLKLITDANRLAN
ncbi:hypothetical protein [Halorhabdus salina]|uniref:hypothetical protein n=1 Tax=Halorhabdus salina TaxID=2750670 RepID=UPI0015EEFB51|nr:hypothetical protein [Halorhabdus salina]